jgi:hypothetical protein
MARKFAIGGCLFLAATALYLLSSGAPLRVHVATLGPWLLIALCAGLASWWPGVSLVMRAVLLALTVVLGALLLLWAINLTVVHAEFTLASYWLYLVLVVPILGVYLAFIAGISRLIGSGNDGDSPSSTLRLG